MTSRSANSRRLFLRTGLVGLAALSFAASGVAIGQTVAAGVKVETIGDGLSRPAAIALRPGGKRSGSNLFIAEAGAGRVVGLSTDDTDPQLTEVITGFDRTEEAADRLVGPTCLVFRSRNRLLVGLSSNAEQMASVSDYNIESDNLPLNPGDRGATIVYESGETPVSLMGIARNERLLIATTADHQWTLSTKLRNTSTGKFTTFVRPVDTSSVGSPRGITFSQQGYLLVSEAGAPDAAGDSLIVFHHPVNAIAAPLLTLETGLDDIVGLAYNPASGNLYAADYAAANPSQGGIYRIVAKVAQGAGKDSCEAELVAQLKHPTALVFTDDGTLYVTTDGEPGEPSSGKLLKVTGPL